MDIETFEKDLIATCDAVFKAAPKIERHSQDNREGNPVIAIVVNGGLVVYPTPVRQPSLSGFMIVNHIAIDRAVPSIGNPELALVPTEAEAIVIVVSEMARDIALQVALGEALARSLGAE